MDIFVSYSSSNKPIADAVVATLERAQIRCWYAPRDIDPGKPYGDAILEGLRGTRGVVVIVSKRALASPQVLREVERAIHYGLAIIPFRIENVEMQGAFEFFLSVPHWLDAMTPPLEQHLDRLTDAVRGVLRLNTPPASDRKISEPAAAPAAPVVEVSPDLWSQRPRGRLRQFVSRLLEDTES